MTRVLRARCEDCNQTLVKEDRGTHRAGLAAWKVQHGRHRHSIEYVQDESVRLRLLAPLPKIEIADEPA